MLGVMRIAIVADIHGNMTALEAVLADLRETVKEIAAAECAALGTERLAWMAALPLELKLDGLALVHASPGDPWRASQPEANDAELAAVYGPLGAPLAVYAHVHRGFVRGVGGMTIANTGSVSLSYDGDP